MVAHEIQLWRSPDNFLEQSSDDIWQACCYAVRRAIAQANISPVQVKGIGFDGTCSLVALNERDRPISLSQSGNLEQNAILWMEYRTVAQAEQINQTQHKVLTYVGGRISSEMQSPRLLWIKENLPQTWAKTALFLICPTF
jgi:ribulose kinase